MVGRFSACGLSFRLTASAPTRRVGRGYDESAEALAKAEDGGHKVHVATVPEARARVR